MLMLLRLQSYNGLLVGLLLLIIASPLVHYLERGAWIIALALMVVLVFAIHAVTGDSIGSPYGIRTRVTRMRVGRLAHGVPSRAQKRSLYAARMSRHESRSAIPLLRAPRVGSVAPGPDPRWRFVQRRRPDPRSRGEALVHESASAPS